MAARKKTYSFGEAVYICGNHVLRGCAGTIVKAGLMFGSYYVEVNGSKWMVRGRNLSDSPIVKREPGERPKVSIQMKEVRLCK